VSIKKLESVPVCFVCCQNLPNLPKPAWASGEQEALYSIYIYICI
jgi:hypothetical protein